MEDSEIENHIRGNPPECVKCLVRSAAELPESVGGRLKIGYHIACSCGRNIGRLLGYPLRDLNEDYSGDAFVSPLGFECAACGNVTEILDTDRHGYHAEVGKLEGYQGSSKIRGTGEPKAFACSGCGKTSFTMLVGFVYWHFDLMQDEPDLPVENFFNEFVMYCTCRDCGRVSQPTDFGKL